MAENISTNGVQLYNSNQSTIQLSYWNDNLSVKINPVLDAGSRTDKKVYNYDVVFSTAFNIPKAVYMMECIKKTIIPSMESGTPCNIGVPTGQNNLIVIGIRDNNEKNPYLTIFKGIDPTTKRASSNISYDFVATNTISNYSEDGTFDQVAQYTDFYVFVSWLKSSISALTKAHVHVNKHEQTPKSNKSYGNPMSVAPRVEKESSTNVETVDSLEDLPF